jgi:phosphoglycerate dehydrogenase-like enzyme
MRQHLDTNCSVAVASHSFPKSPILRSELLDRYPRSIFNETGRPLAGQPLIEFLRGHEKAITGLEVLDEAVFEAVSELRLVSKYGVGLDMIDIEAARRHGVTIRWTPGVNRTAVAELTIALMISLCRSIVPLASDLRAGMWRHLRGRQLSSAVVGILGCGHVGQEVARLCRAFGASVLACDIRAYDNFYRSYEVQPVTSDVLLAQSDIVTVHLPLDSSTRGKIGPAEVKAMKAGALLINTARGGIVNESAVAAALTSGHLAGAAFDVFTIEPPVDQELLRAPNFIGTPHIGAGTAEAVLAMGRAAIAGLDPTANSLTCADSVLIPNPESGIYR